MGPNSSEKQEFLWIFLQSYWRMHLTVMPAKIDITHDLTISHTYYFDLLIDFCPQIPNFAISRCTFGYFAQKKTIFGFEFSNLIQNFPFCHLTEFLILKFTQFSAVIPGFKLALRGIFEQNVIRKSDQKLNFKQFRPKKRQNWY